MSCTSLRRAPGTGLTSESREAPPRLIMSWVVATVRCGIGVRLPTHMACDTPVWLLHTPGVLTTYCVGPPHIGEPRRSTHHAIGTASFPGHRPSRSHIRARLLVTPRV